MLPHADSSVSGLRRVPGMGSFKGDSLVLPVLAEGDYFCAVRRWIPAAWAACSRAPRSRSIA